MNLVATQLDLVSEQTLLRACIMHLPVAATVARAPSGHIFMSNYELRRMWKMKDVNDLPCSSDLALWNGLHEDGTSMAVEEWPMARTIKHGDTVVDCDIQCVLGDGRLATVRVNSCPVYNSDREMIGAIATTEDISANILAEKERIDLMGRERAAVDRERQKSDFIANIS